MNQEKLRRTKKNEEKLRKTKKNEEKIEYYARMYLKSQIDLSLIHI